MSWVLLQLFCDPEGEETAHPGVWGVEPAVRGAAHHAVLRVGDTSRPRQGRQLLPRRRRRGVLQGLLAASTQASQEGKIVHSKISMLPPAFVSVVTVLF